MARSLAAFVFMAFVVACTDIDPDYASDPQTPLYYSCTTDADCAGAGMGCAGNVALIEGDDGFELRGLCVPGNQDTGSLCDPFPFLENRALTPGGSSQCLFPLQCEGGKAGVEVEGDALGCPLGFRCAPDDPDCVACGFVSCDMSDYDALSATLTGIDGGALGCLEPQTGDRPPFTDSASGRVFCRLAAGATFTGCPAGWQRVSSLPEGCPGEPGEFCYLVASIASDTEAGQGALMASTNGSWVKPAYVVPRGSAKSCRPLP